MELAPTFVTPGSLYALLDDIDEEEMPHYQTIVPYTNEAEPLGDDFPQPANPPTAQDWINFRSLIETLYIRYRWTLHQVQDELANRYGFVANDRMFKGRLARWHARAYYTKEDYVTILNTLQQDNMDCGSMTIHDRPIEWPRVRRRLSVTSDPICTTEQKPRLLALIDRAQAEQRANAASNQPVQPPDLPLETETIPSTQLVLSHPDRDLELLLKGLNDYVQEHFMSQSGVDYFWRPESSRPACAGPSMYGRPFSNVLHPAELNQNYSRGLKLVATNHIDAGFSLLERASAMIQQILKQQHPALITSLLATLAGHDMLGFKPIQDHIIGLTCEMSTIVLGQTHPITRVCLYLQQNREAERIIDFWRRFGRLFSDQLGKSHRISIYMNQKLLEKLIDARRYEDAERHIQENLDPVFVDTNFENIPPACLCYLRRKAKVFRCLGRTSEAISLLSTTVELLGHSPQVHGQPIWNNPSFEEAFRTAEEVAALFEQADAHHDAIGVHRFALELCVLVRGHTDGKTSTLVSAHEKRLNDLGMFEEATQLHTRFHHVFTTASTGEYDHMLNGHDDMMLSLDASESMQFVQKLQQMVMTLMTLEIP